MNKIKTLVCRVGNPPAVEELATDLTCLQEFVGGYFQQQHLDDGVYLLCNEEGLLLDLPFNRNVPGRAAELPENVRVVADMTPGLGSYAAPGTLGYHRVYGDFALVRIDYHDEGEYIGLNAADIKAWTAAIEKLNAQSH